MDKDEFCRQFVKYMVEYAGDGGDTIVDDNGDLFDIRAYAEEVAPTYWEDEDLRNDGPKACVEADVECWGE